MLVRVTLSVPDNYGIVNGITNLETLYRTVKGLTFGDGCDNLILQPFCRH